MIISVEGDQLPKLPAMERSVQHELTFLKRECSTRTLEILEITKESQILIVSPGFETTGVPTDLVDKISTDKGIVSR